MVHLPFYCGNKHVALSKHSLHCRIVCVSVFISQVCIWIWTKYETILIFSKEYCTGRTFTDRPKLMHEHGRLMDPLADLKRLLAFPENSLKGSPLKTRYSNSLTWSYVKIVKYTYFIWNHNSISWALACFTHTH